MNWSIFLNRSECNWLIEGLSERGENTPHGLWRNLSTSWETALRRQEFPKQKATDKHAFGAMSLYSRNLTNVLVRQEKTAPGGRRERDLFDKIWLMSGSRPIPISFTYLPFLLHISHGNHNFMRQPPHRWRICGVRKKTHSLKNKPSTLSVYSPTNISADSIINHCGSLSASQLQRWIDAPSSSSLTATRRISQPLSSSAFYPASLGPRQGQWDSSNRTR